MMLSLAVLFLLLPTALTTFTCNNTVLTTADNPYSFGSSGTTNNYNGNYSCTWTVSVPYMYFALLTTNSQLSTSDSVTIVYPGQNNMDQLENAHQHNTFWLPEGESKIQFVAKSNGSLSFNLHWKQILSSSSYKITVDPNSYPQGYSVQSLFTYPVAYMSSSGSKSIALGVGGHLNKNSTSNPYPLRACFLFDGNGKNRVFSTSLNTIYPNVKVFGTVVSCVCASSVVFNGFLVSQDGAGTTKYSQYSIAYSDTTNNTMTLMTNGSDSVAVTVVTPSSDMHLDVTNMKLSNPTTTMVIRDGGANNNIVKTFSQNNISLPFENFRFSTTFSVSKGAAQFSVHAYSNAPDSGNCAKQMVLNYVNSPYYFNNGTNSSNYWGPFTCGWTVVVDFDSYAVLETNGHFGKMDNLFISYPGVSQNKTVKTIDASKKIYLPSGTSLLQFSAINNGTFQMKITWMKNSNKTAVGGITSANLKPVLFSISDLNGGIIYINSTDSNSIGIALATLSYDSSLSNLLDSCFIFVQNPKGFQKTLFWAMQTMMYVPSSCYIYCVVPVTYTNGYLMAASSRILKSDRYDVSLVSTDPQWISLGMATNFMAIAQDPKIHIEASNMTISSTSSYLTISDDMFSNSVSYNYFNVSYPIESQTQITIFSTTASHVDLSVRSVKEHTKFVAMNGLSSMLLIGIVLAIC